MKTLTIIDAYGFLFRAYYVLPELKTTGGVHVSGLYGFINILTKQIKRISAEKEPYIVVIFDTGKKTFRHKLYENYKANRPELDANLIAQFPLIREAVQTFGIKSEEVDEFEADDLIATIVNKLKPIEDLVTTIVTADKDLLQLLGDRVNVFDPVKDTYLDNAYAMQKFGVNSDQIADALALAGDPSDNIPGIQGVGVKTAAKLLTQFGSIDSILDNIDTVMPTRIRENIKLQKEDLKTFKSLVALCSDINMDVSLESYSFPKLDITLLKTFLNKYEINSLYKRIVSILQIPAEQQNLQMHTSAKTSSTDIVKFLGMAQNQSKLAILRHNDSLSVAYCKDGYLSVTDEQLSEILPLLDNEGITKIVCNQYSQFSTLRPLEDVAILAYSIRTQKQVYTIETLCSTFLHRIPDEINASILIEIYTTLKNILASERLFTVYELIDRPIYDILDKIQLANIHINTEALQKLTEEYQKKISEIEKEIYAMSEYEFNIGSPEQVSTVLSQYIDSNEKKTKSGFFSTNAQLLEKLSSSGLMLATKILQWRQLSKLINTYTSPLAKCAEHGYINTHYSMFTSTGRLSSNNYNIHNLPIKSPEGKNIRKAFIPKKGNVLISADYSQIELRIISHICDIHGFKDAFMNGRDIHYDTAAALFDIPKEITEIENLRRKAKAINFGILYGISAFGLSQQLGITVQEAKIYMDNYFTLYPEVQEYMNKTIAKCKETGFVETIFGRKCMIPDINDNKVMLRKHAERQAINAPIQGSAADILKLVLVKLYKNLPRGTDILFQVHDEVIVETSEQNFKEVAIEIKNTMEGIVKLSVPLTVEVNVGYNWLETIWSI